MKIFRVSKDTIEQVKRQLTTFVIIYLYLAYLESFYDPAVIEQIGPLKMNKNLNRQFFKDTM